MSTYGRNVFVIFNWKYFILLTNLLQMTKIIQGTKNEATRRRRRRRRCRRRRRRSRTQRQFIFRVVE